MAKRFRWRGLSRIQNISEKLIMLPEKFSNPIPLTPGKNASVYKAKNTLTGRDVFLKEYPIPEFDEGSALREPKLLTELEHNNLAKIYSADILDNTHVRLEMELVNGGSFQDLIDAGGKNGIWPSVYESILLVMDAAAGLSHLSNRGFVHRDVKPANLLIRIAGNRQQGVVTDLGLVSALNNSRRAFASKHARIYRPPEVWEGRGYSAASDVYQLGIVLFQLLGGVLDYKLGDLDDEQLSQLVCQSKIISPSSLCADTGPDLRKVLQKALAPESQRYSSMSDFLVALNKAKLKELDWRFAATESGFTLKRNDNTHSYLVEVSSIGNKHTIKRYKGLIGKPIRAKNPPGVFEHKDISVCRNFRSFIVW